MPKVKVLIVDDEESLCRSLQFGLEDTENFTVRTETSSVKAFDAALDFKPDVIILDIMMPEMSGVEVEQQLLRDPSTHEIPIIFLTALVTGDQSNAQADDDNGLNVISKPASTERLIEAINRILKKNE